MSTIGPIRTVLLSGGWTNKSDQVIVTISNFAMGGFVSPVVHNDRGMTLIGNMGK